MTHRSAVGLLGAILVMLGAAAPAMASQAGTWHQITGTDQSNIHEVSVARTPDAVLHVAWRRPNSAHPGSQEDLLERSISPGGSIEPTQPVATGWSSLENPALVASGADSLALFVGAIRSTNFGEAITNLAFFSSPDGGNTWELQPTDVTTTGSPSSSDMAAALGSGSSLFEAWGSSSCLCVHLGPSGALANQNFQNGLGDFGYEPGMALDPATGRLVVAWYSNGTGHNGVYAATVDQATGARSGPPMLMPGTANLHDGPLGGRTQIVGRPGGGLYVAYAAGYPSHTKLLLWRVGASKSIQLGHSSSGVESVGVASTPTGRLWAFWATASSSDTPVIHARRSDTHGTNWGSTVTVRPPKRASTSWNLVGDGQAGPLDLLGSFTVGLSPKSATWYTQVLPGLALGASRRRLSTHTGQAQKVTFTVLDAGAPVKGALVRAGKASGTTDGNGRVRLALGPFSHHERLKARATKGGYTPATLTLRVS